LKLFLLGGIIIC